MKSKLLIFAVLLMSVQMFAQTPDPGVFPDWARFKSYLTTGTMTFTNKTFGTLTLENGEKLLNSTDANVEIRFDDDATTLGQFIINSVNAAANLSDNDKLVLVFRGYDSSTNATDYATIEGVANDVTHSTEDGQINFKVLTNNSATTPMYLVGNDAYHNGEIYLENGEYLKNDTDSKVQVIFDDDAATLGIFQIESGNAQANMANSDALYLNFLANDNAGNSVVWGQLTSQIDDVASGSKDSRIVFKVYDNNSQVSPLTLIGNDATFADNAEINGDVILENDEVMNNATDANINFTFDDDAATLGSFNIVSSNAQANMSDNDLIDINVKANDESGNSVTWGNYQTVITDATANSKDSNILFKTWDTNAFAASLTLTGNDATFADDVTITDDLETNGLVTMENDEYLSNSTDAQVVFTYNDDAVELGGFFVKSSNAAANMSDNDYMHFSFEANDDSAGATDFVVFKGTFTDVSDESEDSKLEIGTYQAGSQVIPLTLTGDNATFADDVEINGDITLENDEKLANASDGVLTWTFNDDAATLGTFSIGSSNAQGDMADNDLIYFNMFSNDESGNVVNWVQQVNTITDATANSKDSKWELKTYDTNSQVTPITATGANVALAGTLTVPNNVVAGTVSSFDNGAAADTASISGVTSSTLALCWFTADAGTPGITWTTCETGKIIFHCKGNVTGTPTWAWLRIEKQ